MATKTMTTLSSAGVISTLPEIADKSMAYFFASEYSQSNIHRGNVISLPWIVHRFQSDEGELKDELQKRLTTYLERIFEGAEVTVQTSADRGVDEPKYEVRIDAIVFDNGQRYSLGYLIQTSRGEVVNIMNMNNTGTDPRA